MSEKLQCVVESNPLDENITVHHCDNQEDALRILKTIREEYLEESGTITESEIQQAKDDGFILCDYPDEFAMKVSSYGDYTIRVKIQKLQ